MSLIKGDDIFVLEKDMKEIATEKFLNYGMTPSDKVLLAFTEFG